MRISHAHGALLVAAATLFLPGVAGAQEAEPPPPPPPARAVVEAPAQPVTVEKTTSEATGPSMPMVGAGIGIFALSYLPVVIVGAASGLDADHNLFVPLAGPWIDFAQRPDCPAGTSCNVENTNRVLLAVDGVFQAIGALTIVGGFLNTAHETKTVRSARLGPTLHLAPSQVGAKGYGMVALGTF